MIKFIIKRFIKNYQAINDNEIRGRYIKLSGVLGIICNLVVFIVKLLIGLMLNSIAIISDAFNNMTDIGSSLFTILSARLSNIPPDEEHPYGHGRFEYLSSLAVAFVIGLVGFQLLLKSYDKLFNPSAVIFRIDTLVILIVTILIKLWMFSYNLYIYKLINSTINKAAAFDSLSDCVATTLVIFAMVVGNYVSWPIDGLAGIIIALMIMYSGFDIARDTINLLLGLAPDKDIENKIIEIISSGKYIIKVHELEMHDYGPGRIFASVHAEVPDNLNIVEAHSLIDKLEKIIKKETGVFITIHIDPISTDQAKVKKIEADVMGCLTSYDSKLSISNFRIAEGLEKTMILFDLKVPKGYSTYEKDAYLNDVVGLIEKKCTRYEVVLDKVIEDK